MSQFDITQFEDRVDALLEAYRRLLTEHDKLRNAYASEQQRMRETREQLNGLIERLRALEAEADSA